MSVSNAELNATSCKLGFAMKETQHTFDPANICIYCKDEDRKGEPLTEEHIIATGLGGKLILPNASCKTCRDLTGKAERTLRGEYRDIRPHLGVRSKRRPKEKLATLPLRLHMPDGSEIDIEVPIDQHPFMLVSGRYERAGILIGKNPTEGFELQRVSFANTVTPDANKRIMRLAQQYGAVGVSHRSVHEPTSVFRMMAKIGHSYTVAKLGYGKFDALLTDLIREKSDALAHLIGTSPTRSIADGRSLHEVRLSKTDINGRAAWFVEIQLFALQQAPVYEVVVGWVRPSP